MHTTRLLKMAAAVVACTTAAACTGTTEPTEQDSGDEGGRTLKWLIEEPEDAEAMTALEQHIADFEAESGVQVDISSLPWENMRTVLQTQLRSGEGPDVFNWGSGPSFGGALAEAGLLMDLTDAYAEHGWEVYDFAKEQVTHDGKQFGIPGELETIGLFYNADLFEELGIEEPQSLADLDAASQAVLDAGRVPLAVSDKDGWEGGHLLSMALSSRIGSDEMEALFAGEASWESPDVVASLEVWKEFEEAGFLPESPTSVDYDSATALFYSGDAAMIPTGSWLVGEIDDNTDFKVGYIPFPAPDGPGIFTGGLGSGPFVSATTQNEAAAIEFLDFLASEEHSTWVVENLHTIPPYPVQPEELDVSPLFAQVLDDTAAFSEGGDFGYNIDVMVSDAVNQAMYDGVQGIFTGQRTAKEVASDLQAAAQQ